jgi:WS/DGAT/MGAT family acyltransferase
VQRLAPTDAWFLYLENPTVQMHVTGLLVLDPSTAEADFGFEAVRGHFAERVHLIPALHHRLVEVPFGVDHPIWIDDERFDIEDHFEHHTMRGPGSSAALAEFMSGFVSEPLDRSRPLWQSAFIDGLEGDRVAVATKMHHCTVDGVSGVNVLQHLVDLSPDADDGGPPPERAPEPEPAALTVMAEAAFNRLRSPLRPVRSLARTATSLAGVGRAAVDRWLHGASEVAHPLNAPRTSFNSSVSAQRTVALERVSLDDLKTIKRAFGTTVNDVVLAACTHGLRRYLSARDELPDRPLVCSVPVSLHQDDAAGAANQVSDMFVNLPVEVDDPIERLGLIHVGAEGAKEMQAAVGSHMLGDIVDLIPPALFKFAGGMYSRAGLADHLPPVHNLIVSNVAGSRDPLYMAGAELVELYPLGPLVEGTGLNITAISHLHDMNIALMACPELVPEAGELAAGIVEGVDRLLAASRLA